MRLLNIIRMIQNISSFYNSPERVSSLLVKISNEVIKSCKRYITEGGRVNIWNQETEVIEHKLRNCINLNGQYREAYHYVKNKVDGTLNKRFHFSEKSIFGRFDSFCERLENLLEMFRKISLFTKLFETKLEYLLPDDSVQEDKKGFETAMRVLTLKDYDYLDYRNKTFDKDFNDFIVRIEIISDNMKTKLDKTYDGIWDTPHAFHYLHRFKKLSKSIHIGGMTNKYERVITTIRREIEKLTKYFNKNKGNPLVAREYPHSPGRIYWVRSLVERMKYFLDHLEQIDSLKKLPSYKRLVKQYNNTGVMMMKYEIKIEEQLNVPKIRTFDAMLALPIIKSMPAGVMMVNFDPYLLSFLHENKKLCKLDIPLSPVTQFMLSKKNWFHDFKDTIEMMIKSYQKAITLLHPDLKKLFSPHFTLLRALLEPAITEINWSHKEWSEFSEERILKISEFSNIMQTANDIYKHRVERTLDSISSIELFELPQNEAWTPEVFLETVKSKCKRAAREIETKSRKVEDAVEDLIKLALHEDSSNVSSCDDKIDISNQRNLPPDRNPSADMDEICIPIKTIFDRHQLGNITTAARELRKVSSKRVLEKLIYLIKISLRFLAKHFDSSKDFSKPTKKKFEYEEDEERKDVDFVLQTVLDFPNIEVTPTLDEVQNVLNEAGKIIISVAKGVGQWKQIKRKEGNIPGFIPNCESTKEKKLYNPVKVEIPLIDPKQSNFFKAVSESKEVTKSFSLLSSSLSTFRLNLFEFKVIWEKYAEVWTVDKQTFAKDIIYNKPKLKEFEDYLHKYKMIKSQLSSEKEEFFFGRFLVSSKKLKKMLETEANQWINLLIRSMLEIYHNEMRHIINQIVEMDSRLDRPISNLDDIRIIMETQKKLRDIEIDTEMKIESVQIAFRLASEYKWPLTKDEEKRVNDLSKMWNDLITKSMDMQILLLTLQEHFQKDLLANLDEFQEECNSFCENYNSAGPMQPGLTPKEASDRLQMFQNEFDFLWRKHASYSVGEDLFGLDHTDQPGLNCVKKELNLLQRLYRLYNDVIESVNSYHNQLWKDVNVDEINNELMEFGNRCRKLPKALKEWPAFHALKKTIDDFNDICPLLELMSNKAMKYRHWQKIQDLIDYKLEVDKPGFKLKDILEAPVIKHKDCIEDICISALKERDIEAKLKQVTSEWSCQELTFQVFKNRGELLLRADTTADIVGQAEDSLMILGSLLSNRYNAPFKKQIQKWVNDLSNTSEILERWLLVQNLWVYLEAVFVGGDIAKQLPKEAKRFYKIDKTWQRIMTRAHESFGAVHCCVGDDFLRQTLPALQEHLEMCQRSLTGYLEKKRLIFPRFFFVSDPALLEILGQASDTHTIQSHLLSIFDNIAAVSFHEQEYSKILSISSSEGETVKLEHPVKAEGSVEVWLNSLLKSSQESIHGIIRKSFHLINDSYFDLLDFTYKAQAQIGILGLQMVWTRDSEFAIHQSKMDRRIMVEYNSRFLEMLNALIGYTTKNLEKIERRKYETLITVHMHQREIFDFLVRNNIRSTQDFEWLKQVRFYFKQDIDKTQIGITDVSFFYQNEYLGCQERLVITPLTDRCYITLAQALGMVMGGAPAGPAGTGKTETVKDMAKTLGKYTVVFNCSEQMDFKGLGKIFKGIAQSGSWGCFDEFNRISAAVLSVAAQQIAVVLGCKKDKLKEFIFIDGDTIEMNPEFGIFITMNPTYAGRRELPENLKIQFRFVAMMVPDRQIIIRVKLASCGFLENITLARKFFTLYKLCEEQLSKQNHYDFGLRNILSVLKTLGTTKRNDQKSSETTTVCRVLKDMNSTKLVDDDEPLFASLINDLFPDLEIPQTEYPELKENILKFLEVEFLTAHPVWIQKLIQLFETQKVRHGIMVIGPSGSGKSKCISVLSKAMSEPENPIKIINLNPKSITTGQMFGKIDASTNDWNDGILSSLWRKTLKAKKSNTFWLTLDGPVDPEWIENMNSVLDDNRTLTLANGDRLLMGQNVKLMFESQNVDNASPATVSRCGMVYMSSSGLNWKPLLSTWLKRTGLKMKNKHTITNLFEKSFNQVLEFSVSSLKYVMNVLQVHVLHTLLSLLEALLPSVKKPVDTTISQGSLESSSWKTPAKPDLPENFKILEVEEEETSDFILEQVYIFALIWAIGGFLENIDRIKLQHYIRKRTDLNLPKIQDQDLFDFQVDALTGNWLHWKTLMVHYVPPEINPHSYGSLLIPNISSLRMEFLIKSVFENFKNILLIGEQGSAKSTLINSFLKKTPANDLAILCSNFSSTTRPQIFQKSIESNVDKRMGNIFGPPIGKKLTIFVDDVSMPEFNTWGDQPTNELFRSMIEMKGFYSLEKPGEFHHLVETQFMAAMIHPGGGRNDIPQRLKRHFVTFNNTIPTDEGIDHIFGIIANGHFNEKRGFKPEISLLVQRLIPVTRMIWKHTKETMLPTPAKFHYVFNLRDLSRIWLGMIATQANVISNENIVMRLWRHEITRVIADRFVNDSDKKWFDEEVDLMIKNELGARYDLKSDFPHYFVNFMRDAPEPTGEEEADADMELPKIFEPMESLDPIKERLESFLDQYNEILRGSNMDLVFFPDAIINLIKVSRIIRNPGGNAMLVGVGGSGKQSLTKLASFIAGFKTFQITMTRTYNTLNFIEDLKLLFKTCGIQGQGTTFLFTDQDIKEEGFLEYINNVLAGGQLMNIFTREEQAEIVNECISIMKRESATIPLTTENATSWFLERVNVNFHVVLCFSPIGEKLRSRSLKFPSLTSGCTIVWFQSWPKSAMVSVSEHFLKKFDIKCTLEVKKKLYAAMASVQDSVATSCIQYFERFRRSNNVTPKSYLNFISSYKEVYLTKLESISATKDRVNQGLGKLLDAKKAVELLKEDLAQMEKSLQAANIKSEKVLNEVTKKAQEAENIKETIRKRKESAELIVNEIDIERQKAEDKLDIAKPALIDAESALNTIQPSNIAAVRKLGRPPQLIMKVMDCTMILFRTKLGPPIEDPANHFIKPSWNEALKVMSSASFLNQLLNFNKDTINDETVELLEPYLNMNDYNMVTAKRVCSDIAGLLAWTKAMAFFFGVNKEVLPLKVELAREEARLSKANKDLAAAEKVLQKKEQALERLQSTYQHAMKEKLKITKQADTCRRKMNAASALINGLQEERVRWTQQCVTLQDHLEKLIGNTLLACAFLSYSGPFNQEFRHELMKHWKNLLKQKTIPYTENLDTVAMIVETNESTEWALQGLPTDVLSLQNAAIVTKARSFPLLIDPQGQGKIWLQIKEQYSEMQVTNLNHKYFRTHLEDSLSLGIPLLIEDVGENLDPVLDNLLEKNFIKQGSSLKVMLGDREMDVVNGFYLYLTTKLANPVYSPEISARCAIVDFTVTIKGLEDQLLGRVIKAEKVELESERVKLIEDVTENKLYMLELEENLLEKLNSIEGSIVEDDALIKVLQNTKATSLDVGAKLKISIETELKINAAREEYRSVATRGSILYFLIVELSQVNSMYQTSLKQFLALFDESIVKSKPNRMVEKRIKNILDDLTESVWKYIDRSLYEKDKFVFKLLIALKIDMDAGHISFKEFSVLLKGGASLNLKSVEVRLRIANQL